MITIQQIKAARGLMDWSQKDLALASGMSAPAIAKLEQGANTPRSDTLDAIRTAFEKEGIEFLDNVGVTRNRDIYKIQVFEGRHAMAMLWKDIMETFGNTTGEILLSSVDDHFWLQKFGDDLTNEINRRKQLGIKIRLLIREDDKFIIGSPEEYRGVPDVVFGQTPYYIYKDKFALINWGPPCKIVLIHNAGVAETFRRQFNFNWDNGKPIKLTTQKK